jgi:hypothetical protein
MRFFSRLLRKVRGPADAPQVADINTKNWQQAEDVLIEMGAFQHQLGLVYDGYRERTDSARLALLLDLLGGRAYRCEKDLATYTEGLSPALKRTQIQFRISHSPRSLLGELCDLPNPTAEEVTEVGFKSYDYFISVFDELIAVSEANGTRKLQKVFEGMLDMEAEAKKTFARQALSLADL